MDALKKKFHIQMDVFNYLSKNEIINICRICLKKAHHVKSLFSEQEESKGILIKIHTCFQIILNFEKYFPSVICEKCLDELNIAYDFRQKCVTFEKRFSNFYKQLSGKYNDNNDSNEVEEIKTEKVIEETLPSVSDKQTDVPVANLIQNKSSGNYFSIYLVLFCLLTRFHESNCVILNGIYFWPIK